MGPFIWTFQSSFERTKHWYMVAATIVISAVIVSFIVGAFLLGIVLILFAGVYILYDINTHPEVRVKIDENGVSLNEVNHDYTRMLSFVVIRIDNVPAVIRFKTNIKTIGTIDLFLDPSIDLGLLRAYLGEKIQEEVEVDMPFLERILLGLRL